MPEKSKNNTIIWKGFLSVNDAETVKEELFEKLSLTDALVIDISKLDDIDISILQLIFAVQKEAQKQNKTVTMTGSVSPNIKQFLYVCGMISEKNIDNKTVLANLQQRVRDSL